MENLDLGREILEAVEQYEKETENSPIGSKKINHLEANQAAKNFLKSHHQKAQFKQHPLTARVNSVKQGSGSEYKSQIEQSTLGSSAIKATFKKSFKRAFTGAIHTEINHKAVERIRLPSITSRICSLAIDLISCLLLTFFLSSVYVLAFEPAFRTQLLVPSYWDHADWLFFSGIAVGMFLISCIAYPIILYTFAEKTLGQIITGTRIIRYGQLTSTKEDLVMRAINFPLSVACLGFLPVLFKERALHDYISGTAITRD